jgi:hypothetical protein
LNVTFGIENKKKSKLKIFFFLFCITESRGMEKSPLLANGYNPPPTHLNPMQFMALNHAAHQLSRLPPPPPPPPSMLCSARPAPPCTRLDCRPAWPT